MAQCVRRLLAALVVATIASPATGVALAQAADRCGPGETPRYVFGFAALRVQVGEAMGEPLTCEYPDPNGTGDVLQITTTGLAAWRKATNTPTFTNGWERWALTDSGVLAWTGDNPPRPDLVAVEAPAAAPPEAAPPDGSQSSALAGLPPGAAAPLATISSTPTAPSGSAERPIEAAPVENPRTPPSPPPSAGSASAPSTPLAAPTSRPTLRTPATPVPASSPSRAAAPSTSTSTPSAASPAAVAEAIPREDQQVTVTRGGQTAKVRPLKTVRTADGREALAGRLIVGFRDGVGPADIQAIHLAAQGRGVRAAQAVATVGPKAQLVDVSGAPSLEAAAQAYQSDQRVLYAEPDTILRTLETPNDPSFSSQWGMARIQAPRAWDTSHGSPSRFVAVLDCGIYDVTSATGDLPGHPDINGKVALRRDFSNSSTGADDFCNHGTHVAGIVAANTNNGQGVAGVGYDTRLFNGKVLDDQGAGPASWTVSGIYWAADNGASVINLSLGGPGPCSFSLQSAIDYAWARNVVIVAAAGNEGTSVPQQPASCARVVAVAATDRSDNRDSFSNFGPWVQVAAPGVDIYSTNWVGGYELKRGTSQAAPHVSGLAALIWSTRLGVSNQAVVDRLLNTADRVAGTGSFWQYGRINAATAMPPSCAPRPAVGVSVTPAGAGRLQVTITAGAATSGGANWLRWLRFGAGSNALVDAGSTAGSPGSFTLSLGPGTTSASFFVRRATPGQATTLPLTAGDDCGEWPTFVGGGPGAF